MSADEGAEKGDHIGDADDHRQQHGVGKLEHREADQADHPHQEGVHQRAVDKAAHNPIGAAGLLHQQVGRPGGEDAVDDLLALGGKDVLPGQQIDRDDDRHDNVLDQIEQGQHHRGHAGDHPGELGQQLRAQPGQRAGDRLQIGQQVGAQPLVSWRLPPCGSSPAPPAECPDCPPGRWSATAGSSENSRAWPQTGPRCSSRAGAAPWPAGHTPPGRPAAD